MKYLGAISDSKDLVNKGYVDNLTGVDYTTSGNNRAVQRDSSGNLYVVQRNDYVSQTNTTTDSSYRVLLSLSATDSIEETGVVHRSTGLQFNPSTKNLYVSTGTTNGNIYMGLSTTDSLYTAINTLGWTSAVIE